MIAERALRKQPFAPFSSEVLEAINRKLEQAHEVPNATKPNVQKALEMLRERELIWKANRGEYVLEDGAMAEWLADTSVLTRWAIKKDLVQSGISFSGRLRITPTENLASGGRFGLAYMSVVLVEPLIDLGVLYLAKTFSYVSRGLLFNLQVHNPAG